MGWSLPSLPDTTSACEIGSYKEEVLCILGIESVDIRGKVSTIDETDQQIFGQLQTPTNLLTKASG